MIAPARTLRSVSDLVAAGLIPGADAEALSSVAARYAIAVSPALAVLIDDADPNDPIGRQFLPHAAELDWRPIERADPIGDHAHEPVDGLVHRYPDRVLLKLVAVCPVYCRFCFRREMVGPGKETGLGPAALKAAFAYIRAHPEIGEVILTGGDPFMLSAGRAAAVTRELEDIPHVTTIRWHTRMPIADPGAIDAVFVDAVQSRRKAVYVAVHVNHPRELAPEARAACARLSAAGVVLVSQTVLLRGVNDDIETLVALMRALVATRIKPYYLHHPDLAPGTAHFRLSLEQGRLLAGALRDRISGLAQPHYVVDIPGGVSKALASASDVEIDEKGVHLRGRDGIWRDYAEDA